MLTSLNAFWMPRASLALLFALGCSDGSDGDDLPTPPPVLVDPDPDPDPDPEPECQRSSDCTGSLPYCDRNQAVAVCAAPPLGGAIGWEDGAMDSVQFEVIHESLRAGQATDIEFSNHRTNELWVLHREPESDLPCTRRLTQGCGALFGSTTTIFDPGTPEQRESWIQDFNAWHFMRRPPALAFGEEGFFATCAEARTANWLDDAADYVGPSLWTSDPAIYRNWPMAERDPEWNGTHMDMLHSTAYCTGIAHDRGNAYWVVNGQMGTFDWYDFVEDHGPGHWDHSDGIIHRYGQAGSITRVPNVPGHAAFHDGRLYVADAGGARIVVFDPTEATRAGPLSNAQEPLADSATFVGGVLTELVPPGQLVRPSGLEIHDGIIYVSDAETSRLWAFDMEGQALRSLDTGLPPGSLGGIALSPSGELYFVNVPRSAVVRVVPN